MNLIIDAGNTCIKLAAFKGEELVEVCRMDYDEPEKFGRFASSYPFLRGIVSSVVDLPPALEAAISALPFEVVRLVPGDTPVPLRIMYATPHTLGADRLAAAVGAYAKSGGREVLVIDVGTCITYDFVNANGEYLGGNISPGPKLRLKALNSFTARLPLVSRHGDTPELGNTTETAIRSGVVNGIRREIEGYISDYLLKYPNLFVYLTGGVHLDLHISEKMRIFADDFIVPYGLNRILEYKN
ncbi:MAG: type III pantothenate kinase [Prevotella sp.]